MYQSAFWLGGGGYSKAYAEELTSDAPPALELEPDQVTVMTPEDLQPAPTQAPTPPPPTPAPPVPEQAWTTPEEPDLPPELDLEPDAVVEMMPGPDGEPVVAPTAVPTATPEEEPGDQPGDGPTSAGAAAYPRTLADFGIEMPISREDASYLHPQTLVVSDDNENNSYSGSADGDMHKYLYSTNSVSPIEVRFDIDTLPARNAYLAIYAWDCDEQNGRRPEYDAVYVNSYKVGVMTGEDGEWNTTLISIPIEYLRQGSNYVTIHIGLRDLDTGEIFEDHFGWAIRAKWFQLLLDGGSHANKPDSFSVTLRNATLSNNRVYCEAAVHIDAKENGDYDVEFSLVDRTSESSPTYLQIISTDAKSVSGISMETSGTLDFDYDSPSGEYLVQVSLRDRATSEILAVDEQFFTFETHTLPNFDIHNIKAELDNEQYTNQSVHMLVTASLTPGLDISDIWCNVGNWSVEMHRDGDQINCAVPVDQNGNYRVEITYIKDGVQCSAHTYRTVDNIDKEPPTIKFDVLDASNYVSVEYSDQLSGILSAQYATEISSQPAYELSAPASLLPMPVSGAVLTEDVQQDLHIYYLLRDVAGNVSEGWFDPLTCLYYPVAPSPTPTPTPANLEDEFRKFVHNLAKQYYSEEYDYNKHYYDAAQVKAEWDTGGFLGRRKKDPYSIYDGNEYTKSSIQQMLMETIQQKASDIEDMDVKDYYVGLMANPNSGTWEENMLGILGQEDYNNDLASELEQIELKIAGNLGNMVSDTVSALFTKALTGVTSEKSAAGAKTSSKNPANVGIDIINTIFDAAIDAVSEILQKVDKQYREEVGKMITNLYAKALQVDFLEMYNNIDDVMLSESKKLRQDLLNKGSRTDEEELLLHELNTLLDGIETFDVRNQRLIEGKAVSSAEAVAEAIVKEIGFEEVPLMTDEEFMSKIATETNKIVVDKMIDIVFDVSKTVFSGLDGLDTADDSEKNESLKNTYDAAKEGLKASINDIFTNVTSGDIEDVNGDGKKDNKDLGIIILKQGINGTLSVIVDWINENNKLSKEQKDDLNNTFKQVKELLDGTGDIVVQNKLEFQGDAENSISESKEVAEYLVGILQLDDEITDTLFLDIEADAAIKNEKVNDELKSGVKGIVSDVLETAKNLLSLAEKSAGIGNQADNEVFYAQLACSMYYAYLAAQNRREYLDNVRYRSYTEWNVVKEADIRYLKDFVNRVYAVYETDMVGHAYYLSLDAGWHYQNDGQHMQDAMDFFNNIMENMVETYGAPLTVLTLPVNGLVTFLASLGIGLSKSEYLEDVNESCGWLDYQTACDVYTYIADYALSAQIPSRFKGL